MNQHKHLSGAGIRCWMGAFLALLFQGCSPSQSVTQSVLSGTLENDEVRVASRYGGRVSVVETREGAEVKKGQLLVGLEAPELGARKKLILAQIAELEAGPLPEEIASARSAWEATVADLELATLEDGRARQLFAQRSLSESERDRAATRAKASEKAAAAAKSRLELLCRGTRPERLDQARAQLAELETQEAELRVLAPLDCAVEVVSVKVGDVVPPNREVATLLLPDALWVRVYAPEPWLGKVAPGQAVSVQVDAFPGRKFKGVVEMIHRSAEFTPRNVQTPEERVKQVFGVKVRVANPDRILRAGMSADVEFGG